MTDWASVEAVEEAAQNWSDGVIDCRSGLYPHNWRAQTVTHRPGQFVVTQRCPRCRLTRSKRMNEHGYDLSGWNINYGANKAYLLKGVGRLGVDGKAMLKVHAINQIGVIEEHVEDEAS